MSFPIVRSKLLGWLGDDDQTLINLAFSQQQIAEIMSAHRSGALSDAGYNAILSGAVGPAQLDNFLANQPSAGAAQPSGGGRVAISDVNATLSTGPSPTVAAPFSILGWLANATQIAGVTIPNVAIAAVGAGLLYFASKSKR
jgi:hypothetical protein